MQLHKKTAYNGTFFNECRSLFDQYPSEVIKNASTIASPAHQSQRAWSRTRNKLSQSQPINSTRNDAIRTEYHCMVCSVISVKKNTDTLTNQYARYCKLAVFDHFDQNSATILFSITFPISQELDKY